MGCNVCLCTIEKASYKFIRKEVEKCYLDQIRLRYDIGGRRNREYAKELKATLNRIRNDKDYALRQYKIELSEGVYEELEEFWSKKGNKFIQIM